MTKNQSLSLIAFLGILTMVGFQNCSKVGVQDVSSEGKLVSGDGLVADQPVSGGGAVLPDSSGPVVNPPSNPAANPPPADVPSSPVASTPPSDPASVPAVPASTPEVPNDNTPSNPSPIDIVKNPPQQPSAPAPDSPATPAAPDVAEPGPVASVDSPDVASPDISESDAVALCLQGPKSKLAGHLSIVSGPEVVHIRGSNVITSDKLTRVEDARGFLLIRGKTSAAAADLIKNTRGSLVICGMEVGTIDDTRGNIVLVNSTVKLLQNHNGVVRLINSEIQQQP